LQNNTHRLHHHLTNQAQDALSTRVQSFYSRQITNHYINKLWTRRWLALMCKKNKLDWTFTLVWQMKTYSSESPEESELDQGIRYIIEASKRLWYKISSKKKQKAAKDIKDCEDLRKASLDTFSQTSKLCGEEQDKMPKQSKKRSSEETINFLREKNRKGNRTKIITGQKKTAGSCSNKQWRCFS